MVGGLTIRQRATHCPWEADIDPRQDRFVVVVFVLLTTGTPDRPPLPPSGRDIGTPFCLTVDFDTANDRSVTVRDRDSMTQERGALEQVQPYLAARLVGS